MLGMTSDLDAAKVFAVATSAAAQHDHDVPGVIARTPIPVSLVIADGLGQGVLRAEIIDGARLAITVGKDGGTRALLRWQSVIDAHDFADHFFPAELICKV